MQRIQTLGVVVLIMSSVVLAQNQGESRRITLQEAAVTAQRQLEAAVAELSQLRERVAAEKVPMNRQLRDLEGELSRLRAESQKLSRQLDSSTLDLGNLRNEIKSRQDEASYLSNLLGEYGRNFESRLHIAELQRYGNAVRNARLATENSNLTPEQVYAAQANVLSVSLDRLEAALGGERFDGTAVDASGTVRHGKFLLVGPAALFRSVDGEQVGTAEQRIGSLEPTILGFEAPEERKAADEVVQGSGTTFVFDPTLGNAHKIAATKDDLLTHAQKGGPVMVPIAVMAGAALLVALCKWVSLLFVRVPSKRRLNALFDHVARGDVDAARRSAKSLGGPFGAMLGAGVDHFREPRELVEEVMYEKVLAARLKLQSWLPFIAISASAAPLLGLLGTVTGIMNTFTLMTVFGGGDVKNLSSGISEALITTEHGLIVAIPSLLLHAWLSRKARRVTDEMEKAAVGFLNRISATNQEPAHAA